MTLLGENTDICVFSTDEMPGIDPTMMIPHLNVNSAICPVKQKKIKFQPKRKRLSKKKLISYWRLISLKLATTLSGWEM